MAREFGVNVNQVTRWLREHGHGRRPRTTIAPVVAPPSTFIEKPGVHPGAAPGSDRAPAARHLQARLPKGVAIELRDIAVRQVGDACENAIRPFIVGRRNWRFADTVAGAKASAKLYSLLQTCIDKGIDGSQYLKALLVALPPARTVEDFEALLPWSFKLGGH